MINLTQNLDLYRFYPDISDDEGLGRLYADELGTIEIPEHIQNYFDYEAYGRDVRINEGGVFAPGGYVSAVPEGFKEYYHCLLYTSRRMHHAGARSRSSISS